MVRAADGARRVVELGDERRDVLHGRVVEAVHPQPRVTALHPASQVVEGTGGVLQGGARGGGGGRGGRKEMKEEEREEDEDDDDE